MTLRNSVVPVTASTLTGMTLNQVAFGNSTGGLQGSANLTFNGSTLALTGAQSISGQLTSTVATGTAPFVVASTTQVANLNASQLIGGTWAIPGSIGATTPNAGAFTTLSASGVITSTVSTGTAPFTVASTTVVGNLNVSQLLGATWTAPGTIGSGTPNTGAFTTLTASGLVTLTNATDASAIGTAAVVLSGGLSVAKSLMVAAASRFGASGSAGALVHLKQTADSNAGGLRFERNATSDTHSLFMQSSVGSLQDCLSFYSSFGATTVAAIDRSGIGYFAAKVLIGSSTDASTGALQVTGAAAISSTIKMGTSAVASLPAAGTAGRIYFATNGRKNGEGAGAGTGVLVFDDGTAWRACDTGATVAA